MYLLCCAVDDSRDHIQRIDVPTNLPLSERCALAADGSGLVPGSRAPFPSSLPAPPRVSNLLPPPPRVGTQNTDVDSRGGDSIGSLHDRVMAHMPGSRLMPDNPMLPGMVIGSGWLPPRQNQRGTRDHHINQLRSGRGSRSPHSSHDRNFMSDKWHHRRWHRSDRDRNYPPRRHHRASDEPTRYDDDVVEDVSWQSGAGSMDQLCDDNTSLPPKAKLLSETVSLANDKECNDVSSSSAVSQPETVPSS